MRKVDQSRMVFIHDYSGERIEFRILTGLLSMYDMCDACFCFHFSFASSCFATVSNSLGYDRRTCQSTFDGDKY